MKVLLVNNGSKGTNATLATSKQERAPIRDFFCMQQMEIEGVNCSLYLGKQVRCEAI